jgi:hypothetical protein
MTLSPYPQDSAPEPSTPPVNRRRALIWAGGAAAAIVALAAVGWLAFGRNGSNPPPAAAATTVAASTTAEGAASSAAAPGTTASAAPGPPTGGPGTPAPGLPVSYRVGSDLCPAVDFAPLAGLAGTPSGNPAPSQKDYGDSGYTDYSCLQRYAQGSGNVQAEIFGNPDAAKAWYDMTQDNATGPAEVPGIGGAAFEFLLPGNGIETYRLWVRDGNLGFGVTIQVRGGTLPGVGPLRAAALSVARAAMPKLRG